MYPARNGLDPMLDVPDLAIDDRLNVGIVHAAVDEQQYKHQKCEREKETSHVGAFRGTYRRQSAYANRARCSTSFLARKVRFIGMRNQSGPAREGPVQANTNVPTTTGKARRPEISLLRPAEEAPVLPGQGSGMRVMNPPVQPSEPSRSGINGSGSEHDRSRQRPSARPLP